MVDRDSMAPPTLDRTIVVTVICFRFSEGLILCHTLL